MSSLAGKIILGGAPEGYDALLLAKEVARAEGSVIHVARDDKRAEGMAQALAFLAPDLTVLRFPAWDCLPYDRVSPNPEIASARMATLAALAQGVPGPFVLLTTLSAAQQRVPARDVVAQASFRATVGRRVDEGALRGWLVRMGFSQSPTVTEPGDFAIRGGIFDIYPPGEGGPVRLDLFGDVLDGARRFDPATQRSLEKLQVVEFAPVSEIILDEAAITRFRQNYRIEFGAAGSDDPLYEAVSAGRKHQGMEHWLPFFHARLDLLFEYLPGAPVMLDDQCDAARLSRWEGIADQYDARREAMRAKGRMDSVYKPCPPELLYLNDAGWNAALSGRRVLQLSPLRAAPGPGVLDAGGRTGLSFAPERQAGANVFDALAAHIRTRLPLGTVLVASHSAGARERLSGLLEDHGAPAAQPVGNLREMGEAGLYLTVWPLDCGF
ncbi:MAG: transcription-repair coupling factor, partial [Roseinatronobacter sp.]|nr:transcription-repair coupling factor [Roseinatronobacter sp.]